MAAANTPNETPGDPVKRHDQTEADVQSIDGKSGKSNKSSHDAKSHTKAGTNTGMGHGWR